MSEKQKTRTAGGASAQPRKTAYESSSVVERRPAPQVARHRPRPSKPFVRTPNVPQFSSIDYLLMFCAYVLPVMTLCGAFIYLLVK